MKNSKSLSVNVAKDSTLISTKQLAEKLGTDKKVILANAKKYLPNKVFQHGKTAYWNEAEVTILIEGMKKNTSNQYRSKGSVTAAVTDISTSLTPALKIKKAMELMQEGYEEEMARLKAEKNRVIQERDNLKIELDTSKDWFTIKRMQKLNPDVEFKYSALKKESVKLGYDVKKVFDANYGEVNSYHKAVFESLYFDTLNFGE